MKTVRIVIAVIAAIGLGLMMINFIISGTDIPAGILYLLSVVFGAVFAPDAITAVKTPGAVKQPDPPKPPKTPEAPVTESK